MDQVPADLESSIPEQLRVRYTDFKYVGQGGMGRIIRAHDTMLDKQVAIKILSGMILNDNAIVRFHQEAKAVSKLNHKNVVQVLDFDFAPSGEPYLVMEYVQGQTLDSLIETRKVLPLRLLISLAIQICDAIQHAHSNGIVHRDLKPSNIMLDEAMRVKVLDFGLAKIVDQANVDWRVTKAGASMGSPLYMSPEQLCGEEVDERTDVYSLGLVIYKMATGTIPFENENVMKILVGRFNEPPPVLPLIEENPLLGEALAEVVKRALQFDRDERTASMTELKEELLEASEIADPRTEEVQSYIHKVIPMKKFITKKLVISVGGFLSVLALGIGLWANWDNIRFKPVKVAPIDLEGNNVGRSKDEVIPGFVVNEEDPRPGSLMATNRTVDEDLKGLKGLSVQNLSLQSNKYITVEGIKAISTLPIKRLKLRFTRLGNEIVPYLNRMKLETLQLRGTYITDEGVEALKSDTLLELDLGELKGVTDRCLPHIASAFPKLDSLVLSDTKVTGKGLESLKPHWLRVLELSVLKLKDEDMDSIVMLHPLGITIEMNEVTDKGLDRLMKLPALKYLSVLHCHGVTNKKLDELRRKYPGAEIPDLPRIEQQLDDTLDLIQEPELIK